MGFGLVRKLGSVQLFDRKSLVVAIDQLIVHSILLL